MSWPIKKETKKKAEKRGKKGITKQPTATNYIQTKEEVEEEEKKRK